MPELPTGTVTFLFTDIEGSTKLWGQYPEAMKAALARHDVLLRMAIEAQGGYVFKTVGDAFCAAFNTAPDALAVALAAQRALRAEAWGQTGELRVRMALHTGTAEEREGDYFGPPLNRVARLLSTGHGGQTLLTLATMELVRDHLPEGASLQDLGEHRLKDLVRPEQVFQLIVPGLPSNFPSLKSLDTLPNNLPLQLTSFVGREREMGEVKGLLNSARLVTLLGPGGTGKTRLSLQVAAEVLDSFADGVWLVELAVLMDPLLVPQAVATALGVRDDAGQPLLTTLTSYLKEKQVLLVLDNCEHLVAAGAQLAEALLRACPKLKLLASSREALGIGGESSFPVPPLPLPDARHLPAMEALTQYAAVQLFVERAVAVVPGFTVTNQNAPALAQVCHRLDGIPLAIELAAARVKVLSVEQIAARLDDCFRLLTGGSRTAQRRQQTLRAAIDWSYDLLSEPERILLRRLAVFAGGWTLEAAEAIGVGEGIEVYEALELLMQLADKSLVVVGARDEEARYRLLETIRQYAQDKLVESGEAAPVRSRHLEFFLGLAEQAEPELGGVDSAVWLERLEREHDNLRADLTWCKAGQLSIESGLRLAGALGRFWDIRGYQHEGRAHLAEMLAAEGAATRTATRAKALNWSGELACNQGDYATARALFSEGLAIGREVGDKRDLGWSIDGLGYVARCQGDYAGAQALCEESLVICRELGDKRGIANSLHTLGVVARYRGDYASARALHEEGLAKCRELGDKRDTAWSFYLLGHVAKVLGDYKGAQGLYEEGLAGCRELGDKLSIGWGLNGLGEVLWRQGGSEQGRALAEAGMISCREMGDKRAMGWALYVLGRIARDQEDYVKARALLGESLSVFREVGELVGVAHALELWAHLTLINTEPARAARLCGAAEALREALGAPLPPADRAEYEHTVEAVRAQLDEGALAAAWAEGRAMAMAQAIEYASSAPT